MNELQEFSDEQDESRRRQKKLFVKSSLLEQTVPHLKKHKKTKTKTKETYKKSVSLSLLTNPCSPPAWWPPPLSCGCDDGIKCSAVSRWTQLNVAAVMSPVRFTSTRFSKAMGVRGEGCWGLQGASGVWGWWLELH